MRNPQRRDDGKYVVLQANIQCIDADRIVKGRYRHLPNRRSFKLDVEGRTLAFMRADWEVLWASFSEPK